MREIKWEYTGRFFSSSEIDAGDILKILNREGESGWELIQIIERPFRSDPNTLGYTFYFKRKIII